jgi:AcrR family transcriptional regulator
MARTRQRITAAAIELHGTIGPAATTMSAVADRAGVTRATLYRHFPNDDALFAACSREWLSAHPRPDVASWLRVADPRDRIRTALRQMYRYYRSTDGMLANLIRDFATLPGPIASNVASYPGQMLAALESGWPPGPADRVRVRRAAILHAVAFETWRSLTGAALADDEAADLMAALVIGGSGQSAAPRLS